MSRKGDYWDNAVVESFFVTLKQELVQWKQYQTRYQAQQDIIEGVDYLLEKGISNPAQLAIAGHSFGGFSAMTAMAFTPEKFLVAFAGAAPSDLGNTMLRYSKRSPAQQSHRTSLRIENLMVNIEDTVDAQRLYNQSTDNHWKNISGPVFMWAGERDDRVAIEHIRDMVLRLESADKKVALLSAPKEGHSPESKLAREAYFYMLENALVAYLKGRADQHKSPNLERYINKYLTINTTPMNAELTR